MLQHQQSVAQEVHSYVYLACVKERRPMDHRRLSWYFGIEENLGEGLWRREMLNRD
jgi:hypothetical protein